MTGELQRRPVSHRHQPYREEDARQEPCLGVWEAPRVPHLCPHQLPSTDGLTSGRHPSPAWLSSETGKPAGNWARVQGGHGWRLP